MIVCGGIVGVLLAGWLVLHKKNVWKKIKNSYLLFFVFLILSLFCWITDNQKSSFAEDGKLYRNAPGEGELETELQMYLPQENREYTMNLSIEEKALSRDEEQEKIQAAIAEIEESFCGENASLEQISKAPVVMESYQNELVMAEWEFSGEYISSAGIIDEEALGDERVLIEANVQLICGESEGTYEFYFWLVPRTKTKQEQLFAAINRQIAMQEKTAETVMLPEQIEGNKITWKRAKSYQYLEILVLGILAAITVFYVQREQELKKMQKRKAHLVLEYPEFVSKLSLLLGAGMHILTAFRKMNQPCKGYAYEELQRMIFEIDNGMSKQQAYQAFAERCDLQPYRKLASLLQSEQKMGNRELIERLHEEADRVFAERKNTARRLGEEAGTKLLFPMMLMLIIVMGIVIFPAFLSIYSM